MMELLYKYVDALSATLSGDEVLLGYYQGEQSDFVRFNRSLICQPGSVTQRDIVLRLIDGKRHISSSTTLSGQSDADQPKLLSLLVQMRSDLKHVPEDPYLLYATDVCSSHDVHNNTLPASNDAVDTILSAGKGRDLVGIYAGGAIEAGFANSLGQKNWYARPSFNMDWCFYHQGDKAVKASYAGFAWDDRDFARTVDTAAEQLAVLSGEARTIDPGEYRVFLAPAAMQEIMQMLSWGGGFSLKDHRTKNTSLLKMIADGATLAPSVTIRENTAGGLAPRFSTYGYAQSECVTLIEDGQYRDCLISPRSAAEYDQPTTGGNEWHSSLEMAVGTLDTDNVLDALDTGVYVNTLWYLNYSDVPACRMTGMTRFATFWVEGGKIVAPLNVMRFDETIYRILGENLIDLTSHREFLPDNDTYYARSTDSMNLPGALIDNFRFTL
ncbi:MAG: metallopeptidase TldD-related protein [Phycisphaerae bacterium]|jgi:predicted Zn-dependent protease|nr:metallopeptidase TldD-related protein [Phycisphaerae bacterium]